MSFLLIHADRASSLVATDPVVPAADIPALTEAVALLRAAGTVRDGVDEARAAAVAEAREQGRAEGFAAGRTEAKREAETAMFQLTVKAAAERRRQRADLSALALEVVRRIARDIGSETTIAAIADRATQDMLPSAVATVRVAPANEAAVTRRLADRPWLRVEADETLAGDDCVVETPMGTTRAGLETQLAAIARAWAEASSAEPAGEPA